MSLKWSYGITTVPERELNYLPTTIASLYGAGFPKPILFIDGGNVTGFVGFEKIVHHKRIGPFANWYLALSHLYIANPRCDRYAIFQDDVLFPRNLRDYLESYYPENGYQNCYCHYQGKTLAEEREQKGWQDSDPQQTPNRPNNPKGRGALALVFDKPTTQKLLSSEFLIQYPANGFRGWKCNDGAVFNALKKEGILEYFHYPGLCKHIGEESALQQVVKERWPRNDHPSQPETGSFVGEDFDCKELILTTELARACPKS